MDLKRLVEKGIITEKKLSDLVDCVLYLKYDCQLSSDNPIYEKISPLVEMAETLKIFIEEEGKK